MAWLLQLFGAGSDVVNTFCGSIYYSVTCAAEPDADRMESAFRMVIARNNSVINRVCFYYAATQQEYEDLRQDVLINIWRGMDKFRNDSKESTWIYRICLNTCVSTWRKNKRHSGLLPMDMIREEAAEECGDVDAEMRMLHDLISRLSPVEKALIMMWLDEKSYEEIAEVSGFNRNTVATKLRRIREKLAKWANQ